MRENANRRDWHEEIRGHLRGLGLSAEREDELVEELAAHLVACYDELRTRGLGADAARAQGWKGRETGACGSRVRGRAKGEAGEK